MENTRINAASNYSRNRLLVIILALILSVITTPLPLLLGEKSPQLQVINLISAVGFNILVFAWCHYDSIERNQSLGVGWRFLIIILGVFALVIYLVKSRGFKQGLVSIGILLLIVLGIIVVSAIASFIVLIIKGG